MVELTAVWDVRICSATFHVQAVKLTSDGLYMTGQGFGTDRTWEGLSTDELQALDKLLPKNTTQEVAP